MPWEGTRPQHQALWEALDKLCEKDAIRLGRVARAINADPQAKATARAWGQEDNRSLIDASTLKRWHAGQTERLIRAQPLKKTVVYEYLERSPDFKTGLYRPDGELAPGLLSYLGEHGVHIAAMLQKNLSDLDGTYRMFRPAWTIPGLAKHRVLVSRLRINSVRGFTTFREDQDYTDPAAQNLVVKQTEEGALFYNGDNLIGLGFALGGQRTKFLAAWKWFPGLGHGDPVRRFQGEIVDVTGVGPHRAYPFVAYRTDDAFADIETGILTPPHQRLDDDILGTLEIELAEHS